MIRTTLAGLLLCIGVTGAAAACREDIVELRGENGTARFRVELADTPETRAQGLMYREELATGSGMLFIWPEPQARSFFWMKNTLIPLDILFMDETGRVQTIQTGQPLDETSLPGGEDVQFVLEINGGLAERMGIEVGAEMRHPAVDNDLAAWPCDPAAAGPAEEGDTPVSEDDAGN